MRCIRVGPSVHFIEIEEQQHRGSRSGYHHRPPLPSSAELIYRNRQIDHIDQVDKPAPLHRSMSDRRAASLYTLTVMRISCAHNEGHADQALSHWVARLYRKLEKQPVQSFQAANIHRSLSRQCSFAMRRCPDRRLVGIGLTDSLQTSQQHRLPLNRRSENANEVEHRCR